MKKLMLIGGMLGFVIGIIFGRLQAAEDSTVVWVRGIQQAHVERLTKQQRN
jgi:hypothetical protein